MGGPKRGFGPEIAVGIGVALYYGKRRKTWCQVEHRWARGVDMPERDPLAMTDDDDDEDESLKHFFWLAHPGVARPHECLPSQEWIRDHLPSEMREQYWSHVLECHAISERNSEWARKRREETGEIWDVQDSYPALNPQVVELVVALVRDFETQQVKELMAAHGVQVQIPRCQRCNEVLRTPKSQQCFRCGYDWHGDNTPNMA